MVLTRVTAFRSVGSPARLQIVFDERGCPSVWSCRAAQSNSRRFLSAFTLDTAPSEGYLPKNAPEGRKDENA
jgi:hypothetical protein